MKSGCDACNILKVWMKGIIFWAVSIEGSIASGVKKPQKNWLYFCSPSLIGRFDWPSGAHYEPFKLMNWSPSPLVSFMSATEPFGCFTAFPDLPQTQQNTCTPVIKPWVAESLKLLAYICCQQTWCSQGWSTNGLVISP